MEIQSSDVITSTMEGMLVFLLSTMAWYDLLFSLRILLLKMVT